MILKDKLKYLSLTLVIIGIMVIAFSFTKSAKSPTQVNQPNSPTAATNQQIQGVQASPQSSDLTSKDAEKVFVTRVIDGDTIEIEGGQRVRYIGIDTPESTTSLECFGKESANFNRQLVEGKTVKLEKDVSETDKYGRLLRYVYAGDPSTSHSTLRDEPSGSDSKSSGPSVFVNQYLVVQGYAHSSSYPPDIKYQDIFVQAEKEARENNRGLWSGCKGDQQLADCPIKGNISSSGEKIYHVPGQRYYEKTVIDESKGERWFCTEEEAQSAGWRKSKI